MTEFIFNLIAFVSAVRSVTYVMQKEYKKSEGEECEGEDDPFWKWYVSDVREPLKKDEDAVYFNALRVKFLHKEGNPRGEVRKIVTKSITFVYNIIGSPTEKKDEKSTEDNSKLESPSQQQPLQPTVSDDPDAENPAEKYVWYVTGINDETKKTRKYVIPTCEEYLQRLSGFVSECEQKFGKT